MSRKIVNCDFFSTKHEEILNLPICIKGNFYAKGEVFTRNSSVTLIIEGDCYIDDAIDIPELYVKGNLHATTLCAKKCTVEGSILVEDIISCSELKCGENISSTEILCDELTAIGVISCETVISKNIFAENVKAAYMQVENLKKHSFNTN